MRYQENDLLEQTLALAEAQGAAAAADFLARERAFLAPGDYPQVYYFLACLAGRSGDSVAALDWLEQAVDKNGWFYRAEVLRDDDLAALCGAPRFERLLRLCARRRAAALESACCVCSFAGKTARRALLALHGNTQCAADAAADWAPAAAAAGAQLVTLQSDLPDCSGRFRWQCGEGDLARAVPAARLLAGAGFERVCWNGFSAGCDVLLRLAARPGFRCDALLLQSPWLPVLESAPDGGAALCAALAQKGTALALCCGELDEDCLPGARQLAVQAARAGVRASLCVVPGLRHQFAPSFDPAFLAALAGT